MLDERLIALFGAEVLRPGAPGRPLLREGERGEYGSHAGLCGIKERTGMVRVVLPRALEAYMFRKLIPSLRSSRTEAPVLQQDHTDELSLRDAVGAFPPMRPLLPPEAQNDDLMAAAYDAVEQDLRAAGYLR